MVVEKRKRTSKKIEYVWGIIGNKPNGFTSYEIAHEICMKNNINFWSKEGNAWKVSTSRAFRRLSEEGKIEFVREEVGTAPVKRKIYRVVR